MRTASHLPAPGVRKGFGGGARRTQADLRSGGRETLRGWAQTSHWALLPEHVNGTKVDRLERQRQQAASGQSVEAGPLVLDAAAKSWMDRQALVARLASICCFGTVYQRISQYYKLVKSHDLENTKRMRIPEVAHVLDRAADNFVSLLEHLGMQTPRISGTT